MTVTPIVLTEAEVEELHNPKEEIADMLENAALELRTNGALGDIRFTVVGVLAWIDEEVKRRNAAKS